MGALVALREFFDRREPLLAPIDDPFIQLDKGVASEKLKLRERGAEQGRLNLPPSDMGALDNVEAEIVAHVAEHYNRAQIDANNNVRTYDSRLGELALLTSISTIRSSASRAVSDFRTSVANTLNVLSNSRDAISSSYAELRAFRAENHLNRPAHSAPPAISTYGYIALAWLAETALNAFLLRQNDSMGYLGGVFAAATVGAINVLAAAVVGRQLWPRTNLRQGAGRVLAWGGVGLWIGFVGVWNLLAAHYRDAKSLGVPDPEKAALAMMGSGLESIYSWGLLVAGVIFAVTAAIAGYRMDDPFPGYGQVTRRHNERCEDYAAEVAQASEDLTNIRDDAISEATSVRQELERQLGERRQILASRSAFCRRFDEFGDQVEVVANALLQDYRLANIAAREATAPAHFLTPWALPRTVLPPPPAVEVTEIEVRAAEESLNGAIAEITSAFDAAIARFEPLDELKRRLSDG